MYEEKEALLKKYHQLTKQLVNDRDELAAEDIQAILDERQACIGEVNQLDRNAGQIILNPAINEQLLQMIPLETSLQEKLKEARQKVIANIHALKKEKSIKNYGESSPVSHGLFYDKRK
ncbi:hypothetical protein [Neobacillus soli]|uniref:hypothetical protein n=1 Tax=Neobacillus soli TaxID=220688 RepID=UPI000825A540|nr:hypothetical protein [Neobacillus soli]